MRRIFTYLLYAAVFSHPSAGQEMHFSQFGEHSAIVNPALTGVSHPSRIAIGYRDQWRSVGAAYRTYGASLESRLRLKYMKAGTGANTNVFTRKSLGDLGAGLSFYSDRAGSGGLGTTRANLSMASIVPVSKRSRVSAGLQLAYVQRRVQPADLLFPSQYHGAVIDPTIPSGENLSALNYSYLDLAAGGVWSYALTETRIATNNQVKANAGFAVYHMNKPTQRFLRFSESMTMRHVLHGDLFIYRAHSNLAYAPAFLFQSMKPSRELLLGSMVYHYLNDNSKYTGFVKRSMAGAGLFFRNRDALIVCLQYEKSEQYMVGLSYDVNLSRLTPATRSRGGLEIMLRYTPAESFLYKGYSPSY